MRTVISSKGQLVLPAEIREQDGIKPGQEFEVERIGQGKYLLKRRPQRSQATVRSMACRGTLVWWGSAIMSV